MSESNVRERILQAAAKCFLENDYKKVTTREIASQANANVAMISYYFGNKSQLFEAVITEYFAEIYQSLDVSGKEASLEDALLESWQVYYSVMMKNPELPA
ncbi:TetR/AcrR family transcriptional regulator [Oceanicoccus sp. KOV_DT_Chl]|uniref:TetR/AcrR family transcriptional regulator n=1 Tax=Oceanicoccus sp. KOV_DT_Chl TaxID=1904639 RepID=UPI000C7DB150|nr:TetR family transcriptional regulator [Oceanicoccus sp. KOV_DT_Chl]